MRADETRSKCLSISRSNKDADAVIHSYSLKWNVPYSQAVFRIAREYNQMIKWQVYRKELSRK